MPPIVTVYALRAKPPGAAQMEVLIYLVPLALGLLGLGAFLWSLKTDSMTTSKARRGGP